MRSVHYVARSLIAVLLALSCVAGVATTVQASVQGIPHQASGTVRAVPRSLTISITGVSPQFAKSTTSTVTVHGALTNHTGSAISGIQVQLLWFPLVFNTPSNMAAFAAGGPAVLDEGQFSLQPVGNPDSLSHPLANGATTGFSVSFNLSQTFAEDGYSTAFGDYPLQVQASSATSSYRASNQTFLPYWPSSNQPTPLQVGWVWPLIDTPQQGACPQTLATNSLAPELAAGGRLSTLVNAGLEWAGRDHLTWAIDPALLSDATVMTHAYSTGGSSLCTDRNPMPASAAAKTWLSKLAGTAGQSAFLTPYADVDAAALSHNGLDADLRSAYQVGDTVAAKDLPGTFGPTAVKAPLAAALPTGGVADAGVLTSLATEGGVNTVVLNSAELPSSMSVDGTPYDTSVARTKTSTGSSMSVLRADSIFSSILGSASALSSPGAQFAAEQDFLAQTAMMVAEGPYTPSRSIVIAPPTGWDPTPAEATDLLRLTHQAPWLRATDLGALAAKTVKLPAERLPARQVSGDELDSLLIGELKTLDTNVAQFEGVLYDAPPKYLTMLAEAVAVTESSAWRGSGSLDDSFELGKLLSYLGYLQDRVLLIPVRKILLAGISGDTLVSVQNGLDSANQNLRFLPPNLQISVRVAASNAPGGTLRVYVPVKALVVAPGTTRSLKLSIHSATSFGTTTLQLQLTTATGVPLTWHGTTQPLNVEVTRFGRTLLVIIAGALGVLVLASVLRLRRKRRRAGGRHGGGPGADDDAASNADSRAHAGGGG